MPGTLLFGGGELREGGESYPPRAAQRATRIELREAVPALEGAGRARHRLDRDPPAPARRRERVAGEDLHEVVMAVRPQLDAVAVGAPQPRDCATRAVARQVCEGVVEPLRTERPGAAEV